MPLPSPPGASTHSYTVNTRLVQSQFYSCPFMTDQWLWPKTPQPFSPKGALDQEVSVAATRDTLPTGPQRGSETPGTGDAAPRFATMRLRPTTMPIARTPTKTGQVWLARDQQLSGLPWREIAAEDRVMSLAASANLVADSQFCHGFITEFVFLSRLFFLPSLFSVSFSSVPVSCLWALLPIFTHTLTAEHHFISGSLHAWVPYQTTTNHTTKTRHLYGK